MACHRYVDAFLVSYTSRPIRVSGWVSIYAVSFFYRIVRVHRQVTTSSCIQILLIPALVNYFKEVVYGWGIQTNLLLN